MMHSTLNTDSEMGGSSGGGGSMLDFDYRSLLPSRASGGGGGDPYYNSGATSSSSDSMSIPDDECLCCQYCPELSWRERLLGCGTCMIAGYLLSMGSFFRMKSLFQGDPVPFVLNTTVGNMIALAGSFFLSGPRTQFAKMFHDSRRTATLLYLGSLFSTLVITILTSSSSSSDDGSSSSRAAFLLLMILVMCQYVAITWYTLSYIPFAREIVSGFVQRRVNRRGGGSSGVGY